MERARDVRNALFREERIRLVESFQRWWEEDRVPDIAEVLAAADADSRHAYIEHISARCAADPSDRNRQTLKALVPLTVTDATTLDAVLGRLAGLHSTTLSDDGLQACLELCAAQLATGRPWESAPLR
jgi:hypothetical protein